MQTRLYKTPVAEIQVHYCGQCPLHQTIFKRTRINNDYPPKFTSVIDYHKCPKTGLRVQFLTLDDKCPLPSTPSISSTYSEAL